MAASNVVVFKQGPNIVIRAIWYLLVGWWLAGLLMFVAWIAALLIVTLPLAFYLVNRIPTFLTLRPRKERYTMVMAEDGVMRHERLATRQSSFIVRALYFIFLGWWLSGLWMLGSYLLMLTVVGIPIGLVMVNRVPFIFSLHRGYA